MRTKATLEKAEPTITANRLPVVEPGDPVQWSKTRTGAAAGRGFHYQEAVAALYAAGLLESDVHTLIVPEGSHEDIHCQGRVPVAVQAKSRQNRLGDFPAADVARHLRDLHQRRTEHSYAATTVLAIDRDIKEAPLPEAEVAVGDLPETHPLMVACERVITNMGWESGCFDDIGIRFITVGQARDQAAEIVARVFGIEIAVAERVSMEYRQLVCDAADHNAERPAGDPAFVDRTALVRVSDRFISECDPSNLVAAIASGACEPVDLDTPTSDEGYFKGVHAQPGHIAAGLPTERADLVQTVVAGLSSSGSVLLTGPSGIGKSTAMWMAAYMTRNVTWFRVHRLTAADVEDLYRLASGRRPTESAPVGFLVDGVGLGETEAWDELVRRLAGTPHVYLLGSARVEDTFGVTTLTQSARVEVALDETVAERIYVNLRDAGLTDHPHWREALNESNGLTLEFTYLLTEGERLGDVLGSQVRRLVAEPNADAEVQVLALASTAHAHGIDLPVEMAGTALGLPDGDLRRAVNRLKDEHFVVEASGRLAGLHLMRSRTLSEAVHAAPPPTLVTSVQRLVQCIPGLDVARLIIGVLRDRDDLDDATISAAVARAVADDPRSGLLASVMHAVRSADFFRHARVWADIIREEGVPPAHWPVTVNLSLLTTEMLPGMHPAITAAVERLRAVSGEPTLLWDRFVDEMTPAQIVKAVVQQDTATGIAALLSACRGGPADLVEALEAQDWATTPAGQRLAECSADEFGYVCSVAKVLSEDLAASLVGSAGGENAVLRRIRQRFPAMFEAGRATDEDGTPVAMARLAYIDDELTADPDEVARDAARLLLRSLPGCAKADVKTLRAGGKPHAYADLEFGTSGLLHEYSLTEYETDWNRARSVLVLHELGFASPGEHASRVATLMPRAANFLHRLLTLWVTQRDAYLEWDWTWATRERKDLAQMVDELTAPQDGVQLMQRAIPATGDRLRRLSHPAPRDGAAGMPEQLTAFGNDDAHTVLSAVTYNVANQLMSKQHRQLAFFARSTAKNLRAVIAEEQWELAGLESAPTAAEDLAAMLYQIADISAGLANDALTERELLRQARSGPRESAVARAAEAARAASRNQMRNLLRDFNATLSSHGVSAEILERDADPDEGYWPHVDIAVVVACPDLEAWSEAQQVVTSALLDLRRDLHLPATLVCPEFDGRRERALAFEVQNRVFPLSQRYSEWFGDEAAEGATAAGDETLPAEVECAALALTRRSGLQYLQTLQPLTGTLQSAYDETATMFTDAIAQVRAHGDDQVIDAIVDELRALAGLVEAEQAPDGVPGAVAEEVLDSLRGAEQTPLVDSLLGIKFFAVQWSHDPEVAASLLGRELDRPTDDTLGPTTK